VAAVRVPPLYDALTADGHAVKVVATDAATYFFDPSAISGSASASDREDKNNGDRVSASSATATLTATFFRDADEWPGERYVRGDPVLHVELRKWADVLVIAPLDANTLAKLAVGLCDNCLTCVWRAWDPARPVVLAPAMNTFMWENPFTRRHLRALAADAGAGHIPGHLDGPALIAQINDRSKTLRVVAPVEKQLACGDVGVGGLAEVAEIVAAVREMLTRTAVKSAAAS
jgi:phosphopantothenoylcysteine decarboxylase